MNVYLTYDRYEHDEYYTIFSIETNKQRAIRQCRNIDMVDFISSFPDDCHSFQLQKVVITKAEYLKICGVKGTAEVKTFKFTKNKN